MANHFVIMAGGKGTRFWPLSTRKKAKQFLSLLSNSAPTSPDTQQPPTEESANKTTLIEQTIKRAFKADPDAHIWIVTNQQQKQSFSNIDFSYLAQPPKFLYEPQGKNTLPCIAWATTEILKLDQHATLIVLPADHYIPDNKSFALAVNRAVSVANNEQKLVTLGVVPTYAHTGYGYIEASKTESETSSPVSKFHEKPSKDKAEFYLKSGNYYWNSGMFVWTANTFLKELELHANTHFQICKKMLDDKNPASDLFLEFDPVSVDYGLLEQSKNMAVIPVSFSWNDIGSWSSLLSYLKPNPKQVFMVDSSDNVVIASKPVIGLIDIHRHVIVETKDALLVAPLDSDQKVRELVEKLPPDYI